MLLADEGAPKLMGYPLFYACNGYYSFATSVWRMESLLSGSQIGEHPISFTMAEKLLTTVKNGIFLNGYVTQPSIVEHALETQVLVY
jgi:hypothetical protein